MNDDSRINWSFCLLLIKEVAERFLRIKKYVDEAEVEVTEQRLQLIDYIRDAVTQKITELNGFWRRTQRMRDNYDDENATILLINMMVCVKRFQDLHKDLHWFYTPWAEPETETFLRDVFDTPISQKKFDELNITVAFTEEYGFVYPYPEEHPGIRKPNTPNVIALPRIEKNNPLIWPVLMHEVGHALVQDQQIDQALSNRLQEISKKGQMEMMQQWGRELGSHLLALKLLGPSYLLAYLNFFTFMFHSGRNMMYAHNRDSQDAPSPIRRIDFLHKHMTEMDHRYGQLLPGDLFKFYWNLFGTRLKLEVKKRDYDESRKPTEDGTPLISDLQYAELEHVVVEEIERALSALEIPLFSYDNDFTLAIQLKKRLEKKELISALRDYTASEEQVFKELEKDSYYLKNVCEKLCESPCSPSQIINAGWLAKIDREYNIFSCSEEGAIIPLPTELQELEYASELLQKSIEKAKIHRYFSSANLTNDVAEVENEDPG
jgi:hypothetical protein